MRDIKFRGKRIDNGEWVYGNLIIAERNGVIRSFIGEKTYHFENSIKYVDMHEVYFVGQYTGLKDKNGKEIYEGDLVKMFDDQFEIFYSKRWSSFELRSTGNSVGFYSGLEIIGNIHESK